VFGHAKCETENVRAEPLYILQCTCHLRNGYSGVIQMGLPLELFENEQ
jgi:hypothetical protein